MHELTVIEQEIYDKLPRPPGQSYILVSEVWIIEWLSKDEKHTGDDLYQWMQTNTNIICKHHPCDNKQEVISVISQAIHEVQTKAIKPILHFETHGNDAGLSFSTHSSDILKWEELTEHLQELNLYTNCNLILFFASCHGYAGIKALTKGPRAPTNILIGPIEEILNTNLLEGAKEFYRCLKSNDSSIGEFVKSASEQAGSYFEIEDFIEFAYDPIMKSYIYKLSKATNTTDKERITQIFQELWDKMFMIDICPENKDRFGINFHTCFEMLQKNKPCLIYKLRRINYVK